VNKLFYLGLSLLIGASAVGGAVAADKDINAAELVKQADEVRFPTEPFQIAVKITTHTPGSEPELHEYQVLQKGFDNSIVRTLSPASEAGNVMLLKGADLWVFLQSVSQPVRLPLSQRLTGQVANGDLARSNFSGDYDAKYLHTDMIDDEPYYVMELIAARKGVTYQRVLYWISEKTHWPKKVEFYTRSGRLMKTGHYSDFEKLGTRVRPLKLTLEDAIRTGEYSVLEYSGLKVRDIPDKVFTKQYLRKLNR